MTEDQLEPLALSYARERLAYRQAVMEMQNNKCEEATLPCWLDQDEHGTKLPIEDWCEPCQRRQVHYEARKAAAKRMSAAWRKFVAGEKKETKARTA